MIRWPADALVFSVRAGRWLCYAAGYVEADDDARELLAAGSGPDGTELVGISLRRAVDAEWVERFRVERALADAGIDGIIPTRDAFVPFSTLQPDSFSQESGDVAVVEALPGNPTLRDLARVAHKNGTPPPAAALHVAARVAAVLAAAEPVVAVHGALEVRRSPESVLLGWDGSVSVRPRVEAVGEQRGFELRADPPALFVARILASLCLPPQPSPDWGYPLDWFMTSTATRERVRAWVSAAAAAGAVPADVNALVQALLDPPSLPILIAAQYLAEVAGGAAYSFSERDLAGWLGNLFPEEREQERLFREDLAGFDVESVDVPVVEVAPLTRDAVSKRLAAFAAGDDDVH